MTINQALDSLLELKEKNPSIKSEKYVINLQQEIFDLKMSLGGNSKLNELLIDKLNELLDVVE
jgi:hypothetical protein